MSIFDSISNFFGGNQEDPNDPNKNLGLLASIKNSIKNLPDPTTKTSKVNEYKPTGKITRTPEEEKRPVNPAPKTNVQVTKKLGQDLVVRPLATVAASLNDMFGGRGVYTPTTAGAKIFGEEPIKSVQTTFQEQKEGAVSKGVSPYVAAPLAFLGSLGEFAGGLVPIYMPESKLKDVAKIIGASSDANHIRKLAQDFKIAPEIIDKNLDALKVADKTQAESLLKQMQTEHNTLVEAKKTGKTVEKQVENVDMAPVPESALPEMKVSQSATTVKKTPNLIYDDIKATIDEAYTPRTHESVIANAEKRIATDLEEARNFAKTNTNDEAQAVTKLIMQKDNEIYKTLKATDPEAAKIQAAKNLKFIQETAIKNMGTETARSLAIRRTLYSEKTGESVVQDLTNKIENFNKKNPTKKVPQLTVNDYEKITEDWNNIQKMPESTKKVTAIEDFNRELERRLPAPIWKQVLTVWKANLLTGIATHLVNVKSNIASAIIRPLEDIPASVFDAMVARKTGIRSVVTSLGKEKAGFEAAGSSVKRTLTAFKEGFKSEAQASKWQKVKNGIKNMYGNFGQDQAMSNLDIAHKTVFPDTKVGRALQGYTDAIFKTLDAGDTAFFEYHQKRSLYEQGLTTIKNQGVQFGSKAEKAKFLDDFMKDPASVVGVEQGEKVLENATQDALYGTFRNQTKINEIIQNVKSATPVAEFLVPFSKTPAAFAVQMLDYTPYGLGQSIIRGIAKRNAWTPEVQKMFVKGITRGLIGSAGIVTIGRNLFDKGLITSAYPSDPKTREEWKAQNKIPYAIKMGKTWVPVVQFGPAGLLLSTGATFQKALDETGSYGHAATQGFFGLAKSVNEQTFMKGLNATLNALQQPDIYGPTFIKQQLGSIVPTIVNDISKASDNYQRDPNTIWESVETRIPGLRQTTPKKLDAFGQIITRQESRAAQIVGTGYGLAPRGTVERSTPYIAEMESLLKKGADVRPNVINTSPIKGLPLGDEESYIYQRLYGNFLTEELNTLIQSQAYQKMTLTQKEEAWNNIYDGNKQAARDELAPLMYMHMYDLPTNTNRNDVMDALRTLVEARPKFKNYPLETQEKAVKALMGIPE